MDIKEFIRVQHKDFRRHPWELARLKILKFFIRQSGPHQTIMDIGSGDAFLSTEIAKKFPASSVTAIDINYSESLIRELKAGTPGNLDFLNNLSVYGTKAPVDIVLLMDVLEHTENPMQMLQQIIDLPSVSSKTTFIITVPAYQKLFSQHDIILGHYKRYTLKTFGQLLHPIPAGCQKSGYCFNSLLLVRLYQLLKEKIRGKKNTTTNGIHNWKGATWLTSVLTNLFWIEFKISWYLARTGIKIPGLTCYAICQPCPS